MGISWSYIKKLQQLGAFSVPGCRILDFGSSNLYCADAGEVAAFIRQYNAQPPADTDEFAEKIATGSAYDPVTGGKNQSFVGEVFEAAGFGYDAIDIANGYKTTIVDLNHHALPESFLGAFDLVVNFGTTEHIFNQINSFRAIHDAAKSGGYIFHQLPSVGFVDHCYFTYTGRFFFDLAGYNDYDLLEFWFDGPAGSENIFTAVRSYQSVFPALGRTLERIGTQMREGKLDQTAIPTISANVLYRKKRDQPFIGAVEMSTSVGTIPDTIGKNYNLKSVLTRSLAKWV